MLTFSIYIITGLVIILLIQTISWKGFWWLSESNANDVIIGLITWPYWLLLFMLSIFLNIFEKDENIEETQELDH